MKGPTMAAVAVIGSLAACGSDDTLVTKKPGGSRAGNAGTSGSSGAAGGLPQMPGGTGGAGGDTRQAGSGGSSGTAPSPGGAGRGGSAAGNGGNATAGNGGNATAGNGGNTTAGNGGGAAAGNGGNATAGNGGGGNATPGGGGGVAGAGGGGAAAGKGGAGGACTPAPVVAPVAATASGSVATCTFSDDLGDFVAKQTLLSAAAVEEGGSLAVFISLDSASSVVLRRYVLDKSAGCKLVRDTAYVPPNDMHCMGLSVDAKNGLWCHGFVLAEKKYGFRRILPTPTPTCVHNGLIGNANVAADPDARIVISEAPLARWTYDDTGCTVAALPACQLAGGVGFGAAVDGEKQVHLEVGAGQVAVVSFAGDALFKYGVKSDTAARGIVHCATGVCGFQQFQDKTFHVLGVNKLGTISTDTVVAKPTPDDLSSTEALAAAGTQGIVFFSEQNGPGFDAPRRVHARLVTGL